MTPISLRSLAPSALLITLGLLPSALAHSHLAYIVINGELFHGFDPRPDQANQPNRVGWSTAAKDDGFVGPVNYTTPEITCHLNGAPAPAHAPVRAGDNIHVQWNGWPFGHQGPVLSYLAPCTNTQDGCVSVNKTSLLWTKIDDSSPALISQKDGPPGNWASHVMISNNNTWTVHIPSGLKPGPYVLRHEAIALHYAKGANGAQNYPLCMNLWVEPPAASTKEIKPFTLDNFKATEFYRANDPGIHVDIFQSLTAYAVPGPTVAANAEPVPHERQSMYVLRGEGTPVRVVGTTTVPFVVRRTAGVEVRKEGREFRG